VNVRAAEGKRVQLEEEIEAYKVRVRSLEETLINIVQVVVNSGEDAPEELLAALAAIEDMAIQQIGQGVTPILSALRRRRRVGLK